MSSAGRFYSQNPTRRLVVTQEAQGAYFFNQTDLADWVRANGSKINQLGSLYLIDGKTSGTTLQDVVMGYNATRLEHTNRNVGQRKTMQELGKEICIGTTAEPRLLVMRLVQRYTSSESSPAGDGTDLFNTGYVVVENNTNNLGQGNGRFTVRVARV